MRIEVKETRPGAANWLEHEVEITRPIRRVDGDGPPGTVQQAAVVYRRRRRRGAHLRAPRRRLRRGGHGRRAKSRDDCTAPALSRARGEYFLEGDRPMRDKDARENAAGTSSPPTVAIYARKSTLQVRDAEDKSVTRQIENARAFALARGWNVDDAHIYADDSVSGAETLKLANRKRCLDAIAAGDPPFQVLVMRDQSRFSRRDGDEAFGRVEGNHEGRRSDPLLRRRLDLRVRHAGDERRRVHEVRDRRRVSPADRGDDRRDALGGRRPQGM